MSKIPGTPGASKIPPGAVLLGATPQARPRTHRTVEFQNCQAGLYVLLNEANICIGYKLLIIDPHENIRYELEFDDDVRQQWETEIGNFPLVGEVPKELQDATPA